MTKEHTLRMYYSMIQAKRTQFNICTLAETPYALCYTQTCVCTGAYKVAIYLEPLS